MTTLLMDLQRQLDVIEDENGPINSGVHDFVLKLGESLDSNSPKPFLSIGVDGGLDITWDNSIFLVVDSNGDMCFQSFFSKSTNETYHFTNFDVSVFDRLKDVLSLL